MKKIILIGLLVVVIFFVGCVLFTPISSDPSNASIQTTLWKTLTEK